LPALGFGGAERVMLNLAEGFIQRGHDVHLLLARHKGELIPDVPAGVRVIDLKADRPLTAIPALAGYLRRNRPRALLSSMTHTGIAAVWAKMFAGTDTLCLIRQENTWTKMRGALRGRHRWLMPLATYIFLRRGEVIAVSKGVADDLAASIGISRERITVIYNPVVTPRLLTQARQPPSYPWFLENGPPIVVALGRLVPAKGFDILIEAIAQLRAQRPARLLILGEGPERGSLEARIEQLGLGADCRLPGYEPNPLPYMAHARVFAMPSRWEGLPTVLIEALAAHATVVASDCPSGPREILDNGRFGRLVPPDNPAALSAALAHALDHPARHGDALDSWLEQFTLDRSVEAHLKLLDRLGSREPTTSSVQVSPK
jgi:glycosyltransferase involved in cell wall biosynthesis